MVTISFNSYSPGWERALSNFAPTPIHYLDLVWPTAEHLYQGLKTTNRAEQEHVRAAPTAKEAKRRGRLITMDSHWEGVKERVMKQVLTLKLQQHPDILAHIPADAHLIHIAPWDAYWGTGRDGKGLNRMGVLLEEVVLKLRREVL